MLIIFLIFKLLAGVDFLSDETIEKRHIESEKALERGLKEATLYRLAQDQKYREVTSELLDSTLISRKTKQALLDQKRRVFVFDHPSEEHKVKGYISFTSNHENAPLLVFLRGGNRYLGLLPPATRYSCVKDYTVIGTTYRGGMNEGADEFGGAEVADIPSLVAHLDTLQSDLGITLNPSKKYLLGASRGGFEMLLALQRFPHLQSYFDKAVSLSGPTDLHLTIAKREDMRRMFIKDFGFRPDGNGDEWLTYRSPLYHCDAFRPDFPLLIIQGTEDNRVHLDHGRRLNAELGSHEKNVIYWEIEGATHCLKNRPDCLTLITEWLES